jgi:hypothetical protein
MENKEKQEKCIYNPSFDCAHDLRCPLLAVGYLRQIEKWLYTHRTPKSIPIEYRPEQYSPQCDHDWKFVEKANVAAWFDNPELVMDYFIDDKMTKEVCSELNKGYTKFSRERWNRNQRRHRLKKKRESGIREKSDEI